MPGGCFLPKLGAACCEDGVQRPFCRRACRMRREAPPCKDEVLSVIQPETVAPYRGREPALTIFDTPRIRSRAAELRALELLSFSELVQRNLL